MKYLLLVLIFVLSFFLVKKFLILIEINRYKKRNNLYQVTKNLFFQNLISKYNFIKAKEKFLYQQGYPYHLNAIRYYSLKWLGSMIFFSISYINYHSIFISILFFLILYFLLDIFILFHKKSRDNEICYDLLNVVDSISLQLSAHVSLKDAIKKQYENCQNKDMKKAFIAFETKYELSELNIEEAIWELKNRFDLMEMNLFCIALEEYNKTGNILEVLQNITETLKKKYVEHLKGVTRTKIVYITFGVVIALTNIILITLYPLFLSVGQGFTSIFN